MAHQLYEKQFEGRDSVFLIIPISFETKSTGQLVMATGDVFFLFFFVVVFFGVLNLRNILYKIVCRTE